MSPRSIHSEPLQTWMCVVEFTKKPSPASPMYISPKSDVSSTVPMMLNEVPSVPGTPCGPCAPAAPGSPAGPCAPVAPGSPAGPCAPVAP